MGVKGFNTWFGKTFPQAYVPVKRHVDHLYLDMASFLHEELRKGRVSLNTAYGLHVSVPERMHSAGILLTPDPTLHVHTVPIVLGQVNVHEQQ